MFYLDVSIGMQVCIVDSVFSQSPGQNPKVSNVADAEVCPLPLSFNSGWLVSASHVTCVG